MEPRGLCSAESTGNKENSLETSQLCQKVLFAIRWEETNSSLVEICLCLVPRCRVQFPGIFGDLVYDLNILTQSSFFHPVIFVTIMAF